VQESGTKNALGKGVNRSDTARYREDSQRSGAHFLVAENVAMNKSVLPWQVMWYVLDGYPQLEEIQIKRPFNCGLEAVLSLVGGKWKLLILFHLMKGTHRFGELRRLVGDVTEKVLSEQLKQMVSDGIIARIDYQTVPPHVEYVVTDFGRSMSAAVVPLCEWGTENMERIITLAEMRSTRQP